MTLWKITVLIIYDSFPNLTAVLILVVFDSTKFVYDNKGHVRNSLHICTDYSVINDMSKMPRSLKLGGSHGLAQSLNEIKDKITKSLSINDFVACSKLQYISFNPHWKIKTIAWFVHITRLLSYLGELILSSRTSFLSRVHILLIKNGYRIE